LHIHRTAHTKLGEGVELHLRYFKARSFKGKNFVNFVIKDEF